MPARDDGRPTLARLALRKRAVPRPAAPGPSEPATAWGASALPWSRGLWGSFLPERRRRSLPAPGGVDRRRG